MVYVTFTWVVKMKVGFCYIPARLQLFIIYSLLKLFLFKFYIPYSLITTKTTELLKL